MIARHAFGGGLDNQTWTGFASVLFVGSLAIAYWNIKRLRIHQHRAWMIRAWFYVSLTTMMDYATCTDPS
jgi:uncharacterized membrane protein YozB (DUF420 family)